MTLPDCAAGGACDGSGGRGPFEFVDAEGGAGAVDEGTAAALACELAIAFGPEDVFVDIEGGMFCASAGTDCGGGGGSGGGASS